MEYYGCINRDDFEPLSKEQKQEFLINKNLYHSHIQVPLSSIDLDEGKVKEGAKVQQIVEPVPELRQQFYNFVLLRYLNNINLPFYLFFKTFNDKIYGLSRKKQKKIALRYSNEYYNKVKNNAVSSHKRLLSPSGIEHIKNDSRFKALSEERSHRKGKLIDHGFIAEFLFGNDVFFDEKLIEKNEVLQEIINFESTLKILVSLNDVYHFERDFYFSELGMLQEKYQATYKKLFASFDAFLFTYEKINSFDNHKQASIESLHATLKELELMRGSNTIFIKYIKAEHAIKMTKIRKYEAYQNRIHDDRVRIFKDDWHQFSAKK